MKNWSTFQKAIFAWVKEGIGSLVIEAVAGSGKTTTLIEAIRLMTGSVCVMAFNSRMAEELKKRLTGMPQVKAGTVHSFGCKAFFKAGIRIDFPNMGKNDRSKLTNIISSFLPKEDEFMFAFIRKLVGFAKNEGIGIFCSIDDVSAWKKIIEHHDLTIENDIANYDKAIGYAIQALKGSNKVTDILDWNDMIYLPLLNNWRIDQYDWVCIDEAQDTNPTRRELARRMMKDTSRLVAVGDPRQAIFGFTGANHDSLHLIKNAVNAATLPLSVCYRCSKAIIRFAQQWNPDILAWEGSPEGSAPSSVEYHAFVESTESLGLNGQDGIICRKNAPLMRLAFSLIRKGIACKVEGKDIGSSLAALANKWKVQSLDKLTERLNGYLSRETAKAQKDNDEMKAELVNDKVQTMFVLIERCNSLGKHKVTDLVALIESMFSDSKSDHRNIVTLSSVHKAKGLEWNRVFLLGRDQFMPSKYATKAWQKDQENNLIYVAVTRAMSELVEVFDIPE
jgi:superfamily I DNA/RNA helicase